MKAGIISSFGVDLNGPSGVYFLMAIGFICGFSERLAKDIVVRSGGTLGLSQSRETSRSDRMPND